MSKHEILTKLQDSFNLGKTGEHKQRKHFTEL